MLLLRCGFGRGAAEKLDTHFSFMIPKNFLWNSICSTDNTGQIDHISNSNINIMILVTTFTSKTVASQYLCC